MTEGKQDSERSPCEAAETDGCLNVQDDGDITRATPPRKSLRERIFTLNFFVAISAIVSVIITAEVSVRYSVLTTLERRFTFSTTQNGTLISAYDLGHIALLIVIAIYGHKMHKPLGCLLGGFLQIISCVLWAMPHFMYGPGTTAHLQERGVNQTLEESLGMCITTAPDASGYGGNITIEHETTIQVTEYQKAVTFWIMLISQCFGGAAMAPFLTLTLTYIDENTDPQTSAVLVGVSLALGVFGFLIGFLTGAWSTSMFVDLSSVTLTQKDPGWVGAWWFGSLILAAILIPLSIPIMFFPRRIRKTPTRLTQSNGTVDDGKDTISAAQLPEKEEDDKNTIKDSSKAEPTGMIALMRNLVFWAITIAMALVFFVPAGLVTFLPKFLEVHFLLTPLMANIITAFTGALTMAIGTFIGGYLTSRYNLGMRGMIQLCMVVWIVGVSLMCILVFIECPHPTFNVNVDANKIVNSTAKCNKGCSCGQDFLPVCGEDMRMYYSACQAGCRVAINESHYSNCTCIPGLDGGHGRAVEGWCGEGCTANLVWYNVIMLPTIIILYMSASPMMSIILRCIPDLKYRSIGLGISNVCTSLFGTVPAPIVFGWLIDQTCLAMTPPRGTSPARCIRYNQDMFRLVFHATCISVIVFGLVFYAVPWAKLVREDSIENKRRKEQKASMPEEVAMVDNPRT